MSKLAMSRWEPFPVQSEKGRIWTQYWFAMNNATD